MTETALCPICDRPVDAAHRPFCSKRCKTIDLGSWLDGDYTIPAVEPPSPEELSPEELEVLFGKAEA
ncbi:MAG: DNA gyrase inhibitor YacG [Sandaracinus sp.]|nr:DNA gyrase inhibitor YacG [Sandaracinus sp.]